MNGENEMVLVKTVRNGEVIGAGHVERDFMEWQTMAEFLDKLQAGEAQCSVNWTGRDQDEADSEILGADQVPYSV